MGSAVSELGYNLPQALQPIVTSIGNVLVDEFSGFEALYAINSTITAIPAVESCATQAIQAQKALTTTSSAVPVTPAPILHLSQGAVARASQLSAGQGKSGRCRFRRAGVSHRAVPSRRCGALV